MKYGSVYTPNGLAEFVAKLLRESMAEDSVCTSGTILDPACGALSLLRAAEHELPSITKLIGIDIDPDAINASSEVVRELNSDCSLLANDFINPSLSLQADEYWKRTLGRVDVIIANPPWSSNRIYTQQELSRLGFKYVAGQYDSYSLFIELCISILRAGGYAAFILPDSIFSDTAEKLRGYLLRNTSIKVVARLGEKLFPEVHRATTVIVLQKATPTDESVVSCFRLDTESRRKVLVGDETLNELFVSHRNLIKQSRFMKNRHYRIDVDATEMDFKTLEVIRNTGCDWSKRLKFFRGVEISKNGAVAICPECGTAFPIRRHHQNGDVKVCTRCGRRFEVCADTISKIMSSSSKEGFSEILTGENMGRYEIRQPLFIKENVSGVNYKDTRIYKPVKLLVRKTGLGIKTVVDRSGRFVSQTVYFFLPAKGENVCVEELYYDSAMLNSRTLFYFYMKEFGENEWKSHPYLTKSTIMALPFPPYKEGDAMCEKIANMARSITDNYSIDADLELEAFVQRRYQLDKSDTAQIKHELNRLPDLGAFKEMKY